ncbi:MAG: Gfo/Idh/MocA family oxidoreductase [Oscillospiraceae bacterium]|nr:Gfo/Idh/MocA family oxidoreductase [Oscillospiraceae bacterium]
MTLRIGVIGVGAMGGAHAKYLAEGSVEGAALAALCDTDGARRETLRREFPGVPVFETADALFDAAVCDAVVIAAPHYFHPEIGIAAFARGLHVLTEKPIAVQCSRAKALVAAAERSGKTLAVMFNQRTEPIFRAAREIVQSGALGQPKRFDWIITNWYRTQAYYRSGGWRATWRGEGGGVLMNQAPHQLDLWQWIFGMPRAVRAECRVAQYHDIEVEDDAILFAEYENGATATFRTTTGEYPGTNRLEIAGDRGKLVLEGGVMKRWQLREPEREVCFRSEEASAKIPMDVSETPFDKKKHAHGAVLQNFADHILHGAPLIAPGAEALNALSIANAAYLSAWTGEKIALPVDDERFDRLLEEKKQASALRESTPHTDVGGYSERWQVRW